MEPEALALVQENTGAKGDVISTAELAGTMAAKRTAELIPLCHPVGLDQVRVTVDADPAVPGVRVEAQVKATGRTGVEMEALTAVSLALLTVYDMVKAAGHGMEILGIRLVEKTGGTKGDWKRGNEETA
jgi:cyclic pyranopterin phosphate synthase